MKVKDQARSGPFCIFTYQNLFTCGKFDIRHFEASVNTNLLNVV